MKRKHITIIAFACAVILIGAGIYLGQPSSVFAKAIRICLECVGIG